MKEKSEDCTELKNIKYQNMLLTNSKTTEKIKGNIQNIETFLNKEKKLHKNKPWNKLGKSKKMKLIKDFIEEHSQNNNLSKKQKNLLKTFLNICIERKKLQKIKEINYDKDNEKIISIPNLSYNNVSEKYYIKRGDKKSSILKHLAPKSKKRKLKQANKTEKIKTNSKQTNKNPKKQKANKSSGKKKLKTKAKAKQSI